MTVRERMSEDFVHEAGGRESSAKSLASRIKFGVQHPPDTGQNVSLDHEISSGVKTYLETRVTP